jgi:hypothetical protein
MVLGVATSCEDDPESTVDLDDDSSGGSPVGGRGSGGATSGGRSPAQGGSGGNATPSAAGESSGARNAGGETTVEPGGGSPSGEAGAIGDAGESSTGGRNGSGGSRQTGGSSTGGSVGTAGASSSDLIPAFVAQGYRQRTLLSCDDGRSWVADSSLPEADCDEVNCDHEEGTPRGIAHGNGWFVAVFGWGRPGSIRRSRDGVSWETQIQDAVHSYLAFGSGMFLLSGEQPYVSPDGTGWMETSETPNPHSRIARFAPGNGGRFVLFGEDNSPSPIAMTSDLGETWDVPSERPDECGPGAAGIAAGNGVIVGASFRNVCYSNDDGDTWGVVTLPERATSPPIFDGSRFLIWSAETVNISTDGETWTQESCTPQDISPTAVAVSPDGTFVSSQGGNDGLRFYRSDDGISWERLADDRFPKGNGFKYIEFGQVSPSDVCPGN